MTRLSLRSVTHTYPGDYPITALRDVTLTIEAGEYVALVGPSGSGKSTLLNILGLLDRPTSGAYRIGDTDTAPLSDSATSLLRTRTFGIIFQAFHLMDRRTSLDNAAMGTLYHGLDSSERTRLASAALHFVGLANASGQRVSTMSGGQRQRVAIARAITTGAPVILADEPTGNLDTASGEAVITSLERLNASGTTLIVVTHDLEIASRAHRIITLRDGTIVSDTPTAHTPRPAPPPPTEKRRYSHVRFTDFFADVWRGLATHTSRTIGLAAAIALAVTFALTTIGVAFTARYQVSDVFDATANRRVTVATEGASDQQMNARLIALSRDHDNLDRVRRIAGVEEAAAFIYRPAAAVSAHLGHTESVDVVSLVDSVRPTQRLTVPDYPRSRPLATDEVFIGATAAATIGLGPVAARPAVSINGSVYTVVGIVTDAGLRAELLNSVITSDATPHPLGTPTWAGLEIRTSPGAAQQVARLAPVAWMPTASAGLTTTAPPDPVSMRATIESSVTATLITLTIVSIIAAVIALTGAMTSTVRQRYHEFGLRRTIGARRRHIASIIVVETIILSLLGGTVGIALSVIATLGVAIARRWQPVIEPALLPAGVALALVVGILGSLMGAWKASRISPADALRV
ncbi:MAG: ATP-binding cassette domain-containing protein [Actinomycetaceae bacterium]|nr:ATP-binding cassette domain-containing protein [Actinomycetaceae bacterium]